MSVPGVREYWIVDPDDKTVHIFILGTDGRYDSHQFYREGDTVIVGIFPGLEIDLAAVFAE